MIKIKLSDSNNMKCFSGLIHTRNMLKDYSIDITDSDSYDYAMVGQASIIDQKVSLEESIDKGLDFISKINGDYIIFDGQDSTTLI